eukprot:677258-Ditylum_brightwellii.AAC.1
MDLTVNATVAEIEEISESCIVQKQLSEHADLASQVMFPIRPSALFQGIERRLGEEIMKIKFSNGGTFINNTEKLSDRDLPDVLSLFTEFVSYRN